ncbi:MAG: hypothetical protein LBD27_07020, partial [Tannerella sp.]|nr:hypothetical protein [Tannerella sp.]
MTTNVFKSGATTGTPKRSNKFLRLILIAAIAASLNPGNALAVDVTINSTQYSANAFGPGWTWDFASLTLTLTGNGPFGDIVFDDGDGANGTATIICEANVSVGNVSVYSHAGFPLANSIVITVKEGCTFNASTIEVFCPGNVTINGKGVLHA